MGIIDKIFKKKQSICKKKFFELTYIIENNQLKRFSELAERYRRINGWSEKEMLQFVVLAKHQEDLEMKMDFLERIITDMEKGEVFK